VDILLSLKDGIDTQAGLRRMNLDSTVLAQSLSLLSKGAVSEDDLCHYIVERGGQELLPHLFFILGEWKRQGWIDYSVSLDRKVLAKVVPANGHFEFPDGCFETNRSYQLSRFAFLRRDGSEMLLEYAFLDARVVLEDIGGAAVIACFVKPCTRDAAVDHLQGIRADEVAAWLELLARLRVINPADEPEPRELATWEFHDALFHQFTRSKSLTQRTGATFRFQGRISPVAALKPAMSPEITALKMPMIQDLIRTDPPFSDVLERRRSLRARAEAPMRLDLLGEFLYRVASIRKINDGPDGETLERRYPAAGAIHELEFYVTVDTCEGLARGLYHYNGVSHALARLTAKERHIQRLLDDAARVWGQDYPPQVLITLASRFGRMAWKYERIAYRLTLLNAGVVIQTMYLVATAMGLAPCALGWGDSGLFARAAGLDPVAESSVAEFGLSRMA